ncbi:MAG: dTDP-4-dehydrorhamnose reductase family protein [Armatimonadota bacterium]
MTRCIILGGTGMLGHKMFQVLRARYPDTWCTIRGSVSDPPLRAVELFQQGQILESVDALQSASLEARLREMQPDVVINCIGIIKQRDDARAHIPSITLNALLPHLLAAWGSAWGARIIHISTDCVFNGKRGGYREGDPSDAEDLYGRTKYLGEVTGEHVLTLRTSIIGRELSQFQSLLEWFLRQRGRMIAGYTRAIFSGLTTNYLARLVGELIADHPHLHGLYQVTSPAITKYALLCRLRAAYDLPVEIMPDDGYACDRSLCGEAFRKATAYREPDWDDLVRELVDDPTPYAAWCGALHECAKEH